MLSFGFPFYFWKNKSSNTKNSQHYTVFGKSVSYLRKTFLIVSVLSFGWILDKDWEKTCFKGTYALFLFYRFFETLKGE